TTYLSLHSFPTRRSSDLDVLHYVFVLAAEQAAHLLARARRKQQRRERTRSQSDQEEGERDTESALLLRRLIIAITFIVGHRAPRSEEHTSELQSPCNLVC